MSIKMEGRKMEKLNFVSLVLLLVFGLLVMGAGTPAVYAGGEEETIEPVEEVVVTSDKAQTRTLWFVLGFIAAVLIMAL